MNDTTLNFMYQNVATHSIALNSFIFTLFYANIFKLYTELKAYTNVVKIKEFLTRTGRGFKICTFNIFLRVITEFNKFYKGFFGLILYMYLSILEFNFSFSIRLSCYPFILPSRTRVISFSLLRFFRSDCEVSLY